MSLEVRSQLQNITCPLCHICRCWNNNPDERPNAATIIQVIEKWLNAIPENDDSVWHISDKNRMAKESSGNKTHSIVHPQAIYASRLFISYDSLEEMRI